MASSSQGCVAKSGHVKSNCLGGMISAKDSKSNADNVSILMGTMSSIEIWENTSSWYIRFTMERDVFMLVVPRVYTCALVWQGCKVCGGDYDDG